MFKYLHMIKFLITHDLTELKESWKGDILKGQEFKWLNVIDSYLNIKVTGNNSYLHLQNIRFLFWFRLIHFLHKKGNQNQKIAAQLLQIKLIQKYNVEIEFGAEIGSGLSFGHFSSIIISSFAVIGKNCHIMQNVTVGAKTVSAFSKNKNLKDRIIYIGNDVKIGAHSLIFGDYLSIGNNVRIGAMSFINKDIPDNSTVYTEKLTKFI